MTISVIIISYNVRYFLAQCLLSVHNALQGIEGEIIVVDNASTDDTVADLQPQIPHVHWMANTENEGFAKANNKGLAAASGEFILFLNPDTLLPENFFKEILTFVSRQTNCGAVGVKMIDGAGYFLPESKRSFPSPLYALFKLCGLAAIFPKSSFFNYYALGHLPENELHRVPVLSGACMFIPKKVLDTTGGFDEQFFMYGEDIDLSYRIEQAGFHNYYFGKVTILHFKGESKPTDYLQHVQQFYGAMQVFVKKHYRGSRAVLMAVLLQIAIIGSAIFSIIVKQLRQYTIVFFDIILLIAANITALYFWKNAFHNGIPFHTFFVPYAVILYAFVFAGILWMGGLYDGVYKPAQTLSSGVLAILILLALYALLPEQIRFSRGVVVLSGFIGLLFILLFRRLLQELKWISVTGSISNSAIALCSPDTKPALQQFLNSSTHHPSVLEIFTPQEIASSDAADWAYLPAATLIFGWGHGLPIQLILQQMQSMPGRFYFRFFNKSANAMIGSDTRKEKGAVFLSEKKYNIALPAQKRMKRGMDIMFAFSCFCISILILLKGAQGLSLLHNAWLVFIGKKTWIGYASTPNSLPLLKPGVINTLGRNNSQSLTLPLTLIQKTDEVYAQQYEWPNDIIFMFQHLNALFKNT